MTEFNRETVTIGGRAQTVLTSDGRVWAMVETDHPTTAQLQEAEARAAERYYIGMPTTQ